MNFITRFIGCFIISIVFSVGSLEAKKLNLDGFIQELKKSHPVFVKEKLSKRIEAEAQQGLKGSSDWNFSSQAEAARTEPTLPIFAPTKSETYTYQAGVDKPIWLTGGRLSTSLSTVRTDSSLTTPFGIPDRFHESQWAVSYTQPLLKNRFGIQDRLKYDLKRFDIDFAEIQGVENQESFLETSIFKYLDWVFLNRRAEILTDRRNLSSASYKLAKRKRKSNLIERVDVLRAEDSVRIAEQNLVLAMSDRKSLSAELASILQDKNFKSVQPDFKLYEKITLEPLDTLRTKLIKNSRLIRLIDVRIRQLELSRKGFKNSRLPDISLFAQYSAKGGDRNFDDSVDLDKKDVKGGITLSVPFGNNEAKSGVEKTELEILQLKKTREEVTIDLVSGLDRLYIQIQEMTKVLKLNQEQIESATDKTREEQKLYNRGQGDLNFVIQSQDNEQDAKLNYAVNALTYQKLLVQLRSLLDQLF